jgi:hypothetical protein
MTYLGRPGYKATAEEVAALPDYREAMEAHGMYAVPPGQYRFEHRVGVWKIVDVAVNPISKWNNESYSDVQILPPVRDQIITKLDEENQFSKY